MANEIDNAAYQRLLAYKIPEVEQNLTKRDTMLYALGVGLGADPMDEQQLRYVYEKELAALPTDRKSTRLNSSH